MLLGVRVVNREGQEITFWQAVRRYIGYYISAFALYIGFIWVLFDNRRQGWHDKLAGTYVIYTWDARPGDKMAARLLKNAKRPIRAPKNPSNNHKLAQKKLPLSGQNTFNLSHKRELITAKRSK